MLGIFGTMLRCIAFIFMIYLTNGGSEVSASKSQYKISMISSHENPSKAAIFQHGESPVWDPESQSLYFVDAHAQNVHRIDYNTGVLYTKHIDYGQVNIVSLVSGSSRLLVGVRSGFYLLDWDVTGDAALRLLATVDEGLPDNKLNDGKPDANGRFWAGTKGPQSGDEVELDRGAFYSIDQETFFHPKTQIKPVSVSNGLTWSLNNTILYYTDSLTQKVEAFDFDLAKGIISNRRTIIDVNDYGYYDAIPDGMTIDNQGNLWVALMFGGTVLHVNPDTKTVISAYSLPVNRTTSVAWGGPNMDELFVTTSQDELNADAESQAGAIFTIRNTGFRGVPPYKFEFDNADTY